MRMTGKTAYVADTLSTARLHNAFVNFDVFSIVLLRLH